MPTDDLLPVPLREQLARVHLGNALGAWLAAAVVFMLLTIAATAVKRLLHRRAEQRADAAAGPEAWIALRDLAAATRWWFVLLGACYVAASLLKLPPPLRGGLEKGAVSAFLLQAGLWAGVLLRVGLTRWTRSRDGRDPAGVMLGTFVGYFARLILWAVVIVLLLENVGVQVTALVAGLGIGGAAVALASQTILADLFASLAIVVDQPFVPGDFIVVGDVQGTVEQIGLKTVHLRSLSGEQLIVPSNDLLRSRIRNFQRMQQRRIQFQFVLFPAAPAEKLAALPAAIRAIIEARPDVRFDRAHLQGFADFGLRYEAVYFVLSADYHRYMDVQQAINLELLRRLEADGLAVAYQKGLLPQEERPSSSI